MHRPTRHLLPVLLATLAPLAINRAMADEPPRIVVSSAPLAGIVAAVMDGVGEADLLIEGGQSPHTFTMQPSQATALQSADLVIWGSTLLEPALEQPLEALVAEDARYSVFDAPGLVLHTIREGGIWAAHDHAHGHGQDHDGHDHGDDDHDDDDHDHSDDDHDDHDGHDHGDDDHDDHDGHDHGDDDHDDHDGHDHGDDDHDDHDGHDHHADHDEIDPHLWLDPENAVAIAHAVADRIGAIDPAHADVYQVNAERFEEAANSLASALAQQLSPVADRPYIVFHDAYQYFEYRFGLSAAGSITLSPEIQPGAARVAEIQEVIEERGAVCVFSEPQFQPAIVDMLVSDSGARAGVLDPLGASLPIGPGYYDRLLTDLADSLVGCLDGQE